MSLLDLIFILSNKMIYSSTSLPVDTGVLGEGEREGEIMNFVVKHKEQEEQAN